MTKHKGDLIGAGKYLRLWNRGGWEYVERHNVRGIVAIIAVTDDRCILLVEQHRPALDARVIELPAGLVGDHPGQEQEDFALAAQRELLEETGYAAGRMELIFDGPLSSGLSSAHMTYYRAHDLKQIDEGGGDEMEDIVVHAIPLAEVDAWLAAQRARGILVDPRLYVALYLATRD